MFELTIAGDVLSAWATRLYSYVFNGCLTVRGKMKSRRCLPREAGSEAGSFVGTLGHGSWNDLWSESSGTGILFFDGMHFDLFTPGRIRFWGDRPGALW
jgi:hypothetical protein